MSQYWYNTGSSTAAVKLLSEASGVGTICVGIPSGRQKGCVKVKLKFEIISFICFSWQVSGEFSFRLLDRGEGSPSCNSIIFITLLLLFYTITTLSQHWHSGNKKKQELKSKKDSEFHQIFCYDKLVWNVNDVEYELKLASSGAILSQRVSQVFRLINTNKLSWYVNHIQQKISST